MSTLSPDRWKEISPYLDQLLSLPEDERGAWPASFRVKKPELADILQELLDEDHTLREERFLERSPIADTDHSSLAGQKVGAYKLISAIGKGGMGPKTLAALKDYGAVYLNGIGGAAQYYARTVQEVLGVNLMEFGIPEAMWHLRVNNFPAIVTMDAHGNSLHADVEKTTANELERLQPA